MTGPEKGMLKFHPFSFLLELKSREGQRPNWFFSSLAFLIHGRRRRPEGDR